MSADQDKVMKESLIVNLYNKYHEFLAFMKGIPINQNNQLAFEAFKMIDIGIICMEKVINHCPIIKNEVPVKEPNQNPVELSPEINESKN
jgi:hypothetical protein